jgi:cyclopropane fatty-acyl-phospholipid synthase-like methyltransferase
VPRELIEAVDTEWIRPGSSVLDIGSGRGQISAWLAARGFHVLGADLSAEATKLAKAHFQGPSDRLEFRTLDICRDPPEAARFDALVDRGCFHVLPPPLRPRYAANVAAWAKEGARFLLLCKVTRTEHLLVQEVRQLFAPYFDVVRAEPAAEPHRRSAGPLPRAEAPGAVFWMIRRAARPAGRS